MQRKSFIRELVFLYMRFVFGSYDAAHIAPTNTAVVVGQRMTMNCEMNANLILREWRIQRNLSSNSEVLYTNWQNITKIVNPHFGIDTESNIYANATDLNDAGIYTCVTQSTTQKQPNPISSQLIVFETKPLCSVAPDEKKLTQGTSNATMHCFVNFSGFWPPTVEWKILDRRSYYQGRVITRGVGTVIISNDNNSSTLITKINSTEEGRFYSCRFFFSAENYSQITNATNTPDFIYTWNSSDSFHNNSDSHIEDHTIGWSNEDFNYIYLIVAFVGITCVAIFLVVIFKRRSTAPRTESAMNLSNRDDLITAQYHQYDVVQVPGMASIGSDGTEYMRMNALSGQPASVSLPTTPGMFSLVEQYAVINHNFRIPPPPPRHGF